MLPVMGRCPNNQLASKIKSLSTGIKLFRQTGQELQNKLMQFLVNLQSNTKLIDD
jgi:hypothetical protein